MNNAEFILKNAFVDSQLDTDIIFNHNFSPKFEKEMQQLIKSQKGFLKLINTTAKRVACIIISTLIITASTVFSVEALREPFVEAVQNFFINVKELLTGTSADNIAVHFTDDITQIVATNCITSVPKEYVIDDPEKITDFIKLLTETDWSAPHGEFADDTDYMNYIFEFKSNGKAVTTINICSSFPEHFGIVEIISNGKSEIYNISEETYYDILAFTTQKYYLHKSDLDLPEESQCLKWQSKVLNGFTEEEKQIFCQNFKYLHLQIENFLLGRVSSLKEPDSVYWEIYELDRDEVFTDPFTGTQGIDNSYHIMLDYFEALIATVKDEKTKTTIITLKSDYINAFKNHDIGSIFTVHEVIHDYDYYAVNYPISFSIAPPDWGGIDDYFGHLE